MLIKLPWKLTKSENRFGENHSLETKKKKMKLRK